MSRSRAPSSRILAAIRAESARQRTNPYQIAKASGVPLTTVQRFLSRTTCVPIQRVESLLEALGVTYRLVPSGHSLVSPGTGRQHGPYR